MTMLLRDPETQAETPEGTAPADVAPPTRACPTCQAPLQDGQDWCLSCGESQSSRRLGLPGKRATVTVLALTTVLIGGAVAASYAALNDSSVPGSSPTQVAQMPASSSAPSTAAPAATGAVDGVVAPEASTAIPSTPEPTPSADPSPGPSTDDPSLLEGPSVPPPSSSSSSSSSDTTTGADDSTTSDSTADTRTSTTTTQADTTPVAIKLDDDAAALYDPYKRDTAAGDVEKAFDGDPNTSLPVTVAAGATTIGAGLTVDLDTAQGLREVDLTTKTSGFKVEIYATDDADLPPDVLDTRWAHLKDVAGVGSDTDGKEKVKLGSGTTKYRHVLLWFTALPADGTTVRISELKLLG
jgi:hypothetical protein